MVITIQRPVKVFDFIIFDMDHMNSHDTYIHSDDDFVSNRHPISFNDHLNEGYGLQLPSMTPKISSASKLLALSPQGHYRAPPEDDHLEAPVSAVRKRTSFVKKKFNDGPPEPKKSIDGKVKRVQYNIISGV